MENLADLNPDENICGMLVGHPGSGKTSAIASLATKDEPMFIFDVDGRAKGMKGSIDWLGESMKYIDRQTFQTKNGFRELEKLIVHFSNQYDKRELKYKTLVFDSVGSISEMFLMDSQFQKGVKPGVDLSTLQNKAGMRIVGNIAFPGPDDYNYGKRAWHSLFYNFFKYFTKCNIFLSAWTMDRWGKDPEFPYGPDVLLPGKQILATAKIANELPGYFDEIWEFEKEETGRSNDPVAFKVKFTSRLAKTSIPQLAKCKSMDITCKNFKSELNKVIDPIGSIRKEIGIATKS